MNAEPTTLARIGAWGQLVAVTLAVACFYGGFFDGFLAACAGYLIITKVGITGIARTESTITVPLIFPFYFPGFVPLYYFATR